MRIGLIGYGKMGKTIEKIAIERGHTISFRSHSENHLASIDLSETDIAIEFTRPELARDHIYQCMKADLPIVVGTTAWNEFLPEITETVRALNGSLLHSSNFSVGVNIAFKLNELLAKLVNGHDGYKASIEEIHHLQKVDAPSGTAVSFAEGILKYNNRYGSWISDLDKCPVGDAHELPISAFRKPDVPGTHIIKYQSDIDTIELIHIAHNRTGFALGAVIAAEFLIKKKGVFTMADVLS